MQSTPSFVYLTSLDMKHDFVKRITHAILHIWIQSYERNLVFKKSKLVLNLLKVYYLNLDLTTLQLQSELR